MGVGVRVVVETGEHVILRSGRCHCSEQPNLSVGTLPLQDRSGLVACMDKNEDARGAQPAKEAA